MHSTWTTFISFSHNKQVFERAQTKLYAQVHTRILHLPNTQLLPLELRRLQALTIQIVICLSLVVDLLMCSSRDEVHRVYCDYNSSAVTMAEERPTDSSSGRRSKSSVCQQQFGVHRVNCCTQHRSNASCSVVLRGFSSWFEFIFSSCSHFYVERSAIERKCYK